PAQTTTRLDRNLVSAGEADATAEEQQRREPATAIGAGAGAAEIVNPLALEKELALLGKEQRKAGQVHLLFVNFHLCEVGVVSEIRGQVRRDAVLHIETEISVRVVLNRGVGAEIGGRAGNRVWLDFEIAAGGRRVDTHQGAAKRNLKDD